MQGSQHLHLNQYGIYCFRYTFPKAFIETHPSQPKTILLSLKTRNKLLAVRRVQQLWLQTQRLIAAVGAIDGGSTLKEQSITSLLSAYRNKMADADPIEQEAVYWGQPQFRSVLDAIEEKLLLIDEHGFLSFLDKEEFSNLDEIYRRASDVQSSITEGQLDQHSNAAVAAKVPVGTSLNENALNNDNQPTTTNEAIKQGGKKLSEILNLYMENSDDEQNVEAKTKSKTQQHFEFLIDTVGDKQACQLTKADANSFMKALGERKVKRRGSFQPISTTTKNDYLASCKRVIEYAKDRLDEPLVNVFASSAFKFKQKKRGKGDIRKRVPFSSSELQRLFSQPTHTKGIFQHPYQYWIPLLGLYTGKRSNELCQLHVADVSKVDIGNGEMVWCVSINEDTDDKRLKTSREQQIPLHPHLIELGFSKFVELLNKSPYRRIDKNGYHRLFEGLSFSKVDGYQKNFSRWFNGNYELSNKGKMGFKQAVGIESDDLVRKDFHSFRHTCSTELKNAGVDDSVGYEITGHELGPMINKGAGAGYRHGPSLKQMYDAVCKLNFDEELKEVKPFFSVCNKKRLRPKVILKK